MKRILKHPGNQLRRLRTNKTHLSLQLREEFFVKLKHILIPSLCGLIIAFGNISCSIKEMLVGPPVPTVLEEDVLPHRVAILPFVNKTSDPEAAALMRKMFYNFFSSLNYLDLELSVIDDSLKRSNLYQKIVAGETVSPQMLGQLLGVDAVVYGEVLSLGKIYALVYSDTQAGLKARIVYCNTGQVIWELEHKVHLEEADVPLTPVGLAATVLRTAISHQRATHMRAASELCMQMVSTIPSPPAASKPPPKIQALVHNGADKLLRPGEYLKVALIGDPRRTASWGMPPLIENLPLKEKQPGIYIGAYRIKPQDRMAQGRLIGYLRSDAGATSQWVDTLGTIKIGAPTLLPSVISEDIVLDKNKSPYLVTDAVMVLPGVKLIINPGTVIWFSRLGLIVRGEIQILGTAEAPVRLASLGASNWKGMFFDRSHTQNKLHYCEISGAEFGIRASDSTVFIQNCRFQDNIWGIVIEEGTAEINSSLIRTSEKTGIAARQARLVVKNSIITENNSGGFLLDNSQAQIERNNILNNSRWGLKVLSNPDPVQAVNNWWGKDNPDRPPIIGPVDIQPVLTQPIEFMMFD